MVFYIFFGILYFLFSILITRGITFTNKVNKYPLFAFDKLFISVIISARNEEKNIRNILKDIENQNLEKSKFELILVDDHSEDKTYSFAKKIIERNDNFSLIVLSEEKQGKKQAILDALRRAKGDLIVTTDADCRVGKSWLALIGKFYLTHKPKMIIGRVELTYKTFFEALQSLEFRALQASTVGSAGINSPIMCNGVNLAYEKKAFLSFNNPMSDKFASGDDMFLMHNIKRKYPNKIMFLNSDETIVKTDAEKNIKNFVRQRIRWSSKGRGYKDFFTILSSFVILITNLSVTGFLISAFFSEQFYYIFLIVVGLKFISDFLIIFSYSKQLKEYKLLKYFPLLFVIYPFYVSIIGILSFFIRPKWKGRKI